MFLSHLVPATPCAVSGRPAAPRRRSPFPPQADVESRKDFHAPSELINQESLISYIQESVMRKYRFPLLSPLISTTPFLLSFIFPAHLVCVRLPAVALCRVIKPCGRNGERFLSGHS